MYDFVGAVMVTGRAVLQSSFGVLCQLACLGADGGQGVGQEEPACGGKSRSVEGDGGGER